MDRRQIEVRREHLAGLGPAADVEERRAARRWRVEGPGGSRGGAGSFLLGLALAVAGGYLIMNQVQVTSGYWLWWGTATFGMTLVPLILGIGLLFFNVRSALGWILVGGGLVIIFAGILANLHIFLRQTSLFNFLLMVALFVGGLGLMARSLSRNES